MEIDFLDILYLSYSDLGEDQFSVHEKYYPLHITSSAVSELHYKIGRILQKKNSSTIKLHNNKEIIKLVQFIEGVKDIGISSKRKQKDIEIPDYIICFSPSNLDATLSSHEIAHKFGFVHVLDPFDIMNDPAGFCFHFIKNSDKKFRKWSKKQWKFIKGFYES